MNMKTMRVVIAMCAVLVAMSGVAKANLVLVGGDRWPPS